MAHSLASSGPGRRESDRSLFLPFLLGTAGVIGDEDELSEVKWASADEANELLTHMYEPDGRDPAKHRGPL
jgi:hypothetical protein